MTLIRIVLVLSLSELIAAKAVFAVPVSLKPFP